MNDDINDFLADETTQDPAGTQEFDQQNDDPFADEGTSQEDVTEGDEDGQGDATTPKKLPFHEDPKVQRYIDRQVKKALSQQVPVQQNQAPSQEATQKDSKVSEVFTRLIGNDTPEKVAVVKELQDVFEQYGKGAADAAYNRFLEEQQADTQQQAADMEAIEDGFDSIEDTFNVDISSPQSKKLRNEFIDFMTKISPKDAEGDIIAFPDFVETFAAFQDLKKGTQQPSRAKSLSSRSMTRSAPVSAKQAGGSSWNDVDKYMETLGN